MKVFEFWYFPEVVSMIDNLISILIRNKYFGIQCCIGLQFVNNNKILKS